MPVNGFNAKLNFCNKEVVQNNCFSGPIKITALAYLVALNNLEL